MVDITKRNVLKMLSGSAVIATAPSLTLANARLFDPHGAANGAISETVVPVNAGAELNIELSVDPMPIVRLTNKSNQSIVVKHIHPGIVHAGAKTFDLNSIFVDGAYEIEAGSSREFEIVPTFSTQAEISFPRHLYRSKPQRVVAVQGTDRNGEIVNSSRSFYA